MDTFKKFLSIGSRPNATTFPELPDCLIWMRFVLAISYGAFYLGTMAPSTMNRGATPLLMAMNFVSFAPMVYATLILQANSESYGGKLLFAGMANSMALVLLIWIYYYTLNHEEEEQKLMNLLAAKIVGGDSDPSDAAAAADEIETESYVPPVEDEPEF